MRRISHIMPHWAIPVLAALLFALHVAGCASKAAEPNPGEPAAPAVRTVTVQRGTVSRTMEVTGEVVAANKITIASTVEGPITFFPWREGDRVARRGDRLVLIDRAMYHAEVRAAESTLAVAQAKLDDFRAGTRPEEIAQARESVRRLEEAVRFAESDRERIASLVQIGAVAGEVKERAEVAYADASAQLEAARQRLLMLETGPTRTELVVQEALANEAESRLQLARTRLAECSIRAPFAGVVSKTYVNAGDMASVKGPLLDLYDPAGLVIRFAVPERVSAMAFDSLKLTVHLDANPASGFSAHIVRAYPELDQRMRTRTLEAVPDSVVTLMPGMFARIELDLETASNALVIPNAAVVRDAGGGAAVFRVEDGRAVRVPVALGIEQGERVEVKEGLAQGQEIVAGGLGRLIDGMSIRTVTQKAQETGTRKDPQGGAQ